MTCGIYKIENLINGKCYIGQSVNIEHRFQKHKCANDNFYIHNALKKYGIQNFIFSIVEECSPEQLNEKEKMYIQVYNSLMPNGYNMIEGGSNGVGLNKRKKVYQYNLQGEKINSYNSAKEASEKTGLSHGTICSCCRGERKQTGGYQWRYENSNLPLKCFQEIIKTETKKIIQQLDENNNIIGEYPTLSAAGKSNKISISNISECCNGKRKTAGGFKWVKNISKKEKKIIKEIKGENKYAQEC